MAARRLYHRLLRTALAAVPLLAAGVVWAGPAHADATAFVNDLHKAGIHAVTGGDAALVQTGLKLCQQLSWGASPYQLETLALQRSDTDQGAAGLTPQQADAVVVDALKDLCPNA